MKKHIFNSGFTLVETLVAIAIIMFAITGPFMSAERTVVVASIVRDKMTASFLAQEGLEYSRALRDKVYLNECYKDSSTCKNWWKDYSSGTVNSMKQCTANTPCSLDTSIGKSTYRMVTRSPFSTVNTHELHICGAGTSGRAGASRSSGRAGASSGSTCGRLFLNKLTGQYTTTAGGVNTVSTPFVRTIQQQTFKNSPDIKIISTVTWTNHGHTYSSSVSDHLTPWY